MGIPSQQNLSDREASFEEFFRAHQVDVLAFTLRRVDSTTAHDVTAETFAVAWRRWDELPASRPLPWLYGVARRVLANMRRGERRQKAVADELAHIRRDADRREDWGLADAFAELGARDQEALMLVAWEGLAPREAAAVLGISYTAFRVRAHRARRRLRIALGWNEEEKPRTDLMQTTRIRTKEQENA